MRRKIFRQCWSTALQKNHPPVANRQSPFAVHYSLLAAVLARQNLALPLFHAPCPLPHVPSKVGGQSRCYSLSRQSPIASRYFPLYGCIVTLMALW